jgi:enamine deaminase RidA (YjgF/YER057c/UK114 family)
MPRISRVRSPGVEEPPEGSFSNCLVADGVAYIAGMTARGRGVPHVEGGEYEQTRAVLGKVRALVEAAGGGMGDVVKLTVFVTDIARREDVWRARREFFTGDFPASTLVEVSALAHPTMKVEIEAVAHLGASEAGSRGP